ncbi:MAG TPA: hypothetical protein ENN55_02870 [Firmicutes bacterium]|nr:hypothetical protein [Bacillota bacterium]
MKRIAAVMVFVMFCFSAVYAKDPGRLFGNFFGGYATVSMSDLNEEINQAYDTGVLFPDRSKQNAENGYIVGADIGLIPWGGLMIMLRGEYIGGLEGSYKSDPDGDYLDVSMKPVLIPIMAGVKYEIDVPTTAFFISAGVFGGYGIANVETKISFLGVEAENEFTGGGLVAEIAGEFGLRTSESVSFAINVLYRMANIEEVKAVKSAMGYDEGQVLENGGTGNPIEMDFSGLTLGGSMLFRF